MIEPEVRKRSSFGKNASDATVQRVLTLTRRVSLQRENTQTDHREEKYVLTYNKLCQLFKTFRIAQIRRT